MKITPKKMAMLSLGTLTLVSLLVYQNCSQSFKSSEGDQSSMALSDSNASDTPEVATFASVVGDPSICGGSSTYCRYYPDEDLSKPLQYLCVSPTVLEAKSPVYRGTVTARYRWGIAAGVFSGTPITCVSSEDYLNYTVTVPAQTVCRYDSFSKTAVREIIYSPPDSASYAYFTQSDIDKSKPNCSGQSVYFNLTKQPRYTLGSFSSPPSTCSYTIYPSIYGIQTPRGIGDDASKTDAVNNAAMLAFIKQYAPGLCKFSVSNGATSYNLVDDGKDGRIRLNGCSLYETGTSYNRAVCNCAIVVPGVPTTSTCQRDLSYDVRFNGTIPDLSVSSGGLVCTEYNGAAQCIRTAPVAGTACDQYSAVVGTPNEPALEIYSNVHCDGWDEKVFCEYKSLGCGKGTCQCANHGKYNAAGKCIRTSNNVEITPSGSRQTATTVNTCVTTVPPPGPPSPPSQPGGPPTSPLAGTACDQYSAVVGTASDPALEIYSSVHCSGWDEKVFCEYKSLGCGKGTCQCANHGIYNAAGKCIRTSNNVEITPSGSRQTATTVNTCVTTAPPSPPTSPPPGPTTSPLAGTACDQYSAVVGTPNEPALEIYSSVHCSGWDEKVFCEYKSLGCGKGTCQCANHGIYNSVGKCIRTSNNAEITPIGSRQTATTVNTCVVSPLMGTACSQYSEVVGPVLVAFSNVHCSGWDEKVFCEYKSLGCGKGTCQCANHGVYNAEGKCIRSADNTEITPVGSRQEATTIDLCLPGPEIIN